MGNSSSSNDYVSDTIARDIIQVYQSNTVKNSRRRSGRVTRNGRSATMRLLSEEKRAKIRGQQSHRLTLSDMELVFEGDKCRLVLHLF